MHHRTAPIVAFTIYGCPYCKAAIKFLKENKLPFKVTNIGNNAQMMNNLARSTGSPTVPKIFVQGRFIGGYDNLMEKAESGELGHLLSLPMA
jgi:glutaredoxin 3